jgi:hypothetical protein
VSLFGRPPAPQRVPTLTEVVEIARAAPAAVVSPDATNEIEQTPAVAPSITPQQEQAAVVRHAAMPTEDELIERVLGDLQRQVELMLEYRMREVLAPALARATESLVRDARIELASTLRDMVARAVAQEMTRHRGR